MSMKPIGMVAMMTIAGCAASSSLDPGSPAPVADDGGSDGAGDEQPAFPNEAGVEQADASDGCPAVAKLVYVTGVGNKLYSFYPPKLEFTLIGRLDCLDIPAPDGGTLSSYSPTHMTVDRQGTAWVVGTSGYLYRASTKDASCAVVPTWKPFMTLFGDFALTFVGTSNAVDNTLYLLNWRNGLAKLDIPSGTLTKIAAAPAAQALGDMTSNGDGTLYFLHDTAALTLYDLNPSNGAVIDTGSVGATGGVSQALAFWGGSFYAFEAGVIYQYDPKAKTTTSLGNAPLEVTGAGQSTCVPKVAPPPN